MTGPDPRPGKARAWRFNSLLSHTAMMALGLVAVFIATTMFELYRRPAPSTATLNLYETARLLQGLPIGKVPPGVTVERRATVPGQPDDRTARLYVEGIADFARQAPDTVRVYLEAGPQAPIADLEYERRTYSAERAFNPVVFGPFKAALRRPDGSWTVLERKGANPFELWQIKHLYFAAGWGLAGLILAFWFGNRLAKPVRQFSEAVSRVGGNSLIEVPERGPDEIRQAARALNEMQARIRRYVGERTSMVGAIAHDLRSPLSRLNFYLADASEDVRRNAQAEIREMEQLIRVTLDFVEHDKRTHEPQRLDLSLLVESVIDDYADIGAKVRMDERCSTILTGDPLLLKRLFANLIGNALKFAGEATVTVREDADHVVIEVIDNGPGMSPENLERAFEPFYRGEPSRNRRTGGVGLGLAIVKYAADAHDGEVLLENRENGGLKARVRLPIA